MEQPRGAGAKFLKISAESMAGREISETARYELIYNTLMEPGKATKQRMRKNRVQTENLITAALEDKVATNRWGAEIAKDGEASSRGIVALPPRINSQSLSPSSPRQAFRY